MKCMRKKPEFDAERLDDILGRIINNSISDSEQIQEIAPELNYLIEEGFVFYSDGGTEQPPSIRITHTGYQRYCSGGFTELKQKRYARIRQTITTIVSVITAIVSVLTLVTTVLTCICHQTS